MTARASVSKVAIAMPVYNGEAHLEEVLTSIENQTFQDFTVVICDNASTDATPTIAKKFAQRSDNFIYVRMEEFVGALDNMVRAYELSDKRSKYCVIMHDDNVYAPTFLEKMTSYMDANPECAVCGFFLHYVNQRSGKVTARHDVPISPFLRRSKLLYLALETRSVINTFILHCFMRRSAIDGIDLVPDVDDYPERYYLAQLRGLGTFHVVEEDLATFYGFGIGETGEDPWVKARSFMRFGERELSFISGLRQLTRLEKFVVSQKYAYVTLRHKIPGTVRRWWLFPAYAAANLAGFIRPNKWKFEDGKVVKCGNT